MAGAQGCPNEEVGQAHIRDKSEANSSLNHDSCSLTIAEDRGLNLCSMQ